MTLSQHTPSASDLTRSLEAHLEAWAGPPVGPCGVRRLSTEAAMFYALLPGLGAARARRGAHLFLSCAHLAAREWAASQRLAGGAAVRAEQVYLEVLQADRRFLDTHARTALTVATCFLGALILSLGTWWLPVCVLWPLVMLAQAARARSGRTLGR